MSRVSATNENHWNTLRFSRDLRFGTSSQLRRRSAIDNPCAPFIYTFFRSKRVSRIAYERSEFFRQTFVRNSYSSLKFLFSLAFKIARHTTVHFTELIFYFPIWSTQWRTRRRTPDGKTKLTAYFQKHGKKEAKNSTTNVRKSLKCHHNCLFKEKCTRFTHIMYRYKGSKDMVDLQVKLYIYIYKCRRMVFFIYTTIEHRY